MKKIFVSFAIKDRKLKKTLIEQYMSDKETVDFIDRGIAKPFKRKMWRKECRKVINECDGMVVLLTKNTLEAYGVRWELRCAIQHNKKILALRTCSLIEDEIVPEIKKNDVEIKDWTNNHLHSFINELNTN